MERRRKNEVFLAFDADDAELKRETLELYWVCYVAAGWSFHVVIDGRLPKLKPMRLSLDEDLHEQFVERVRMFGRYAMLGERGRLERLFWYYLSRKEIGGYIVLPHVSYIKRETMNATYESIFR